MHTTADITFEQCAGSCCSDFVNLEEPPQDSTWANHLSGPIHSLFEYDKFHHIDNGKFLPLPRAIYDKLKPTLRLASRLLKDDRAVDWVCTIHDGTLHSGLDGNSSPLSWAEVDADELPFNESKHPHPPQEHLTRSAPRVLDAEKSRERSAVILDNLAGVLKCIVFDEDQKTPGLATLIPSLSQDPFRHLDQTAQHNFPRAMAARIRLSASKAQIYEDEPSLQSQYFLARIIVHELAHVLNKAIHGYRQHEVFCGDSVTNESGFELENALFGGTHETWDLRCFTDRISEPTPVVILEHWPSPTVFYHYRRKSFDFTRRREPENYLGVSRVPFDFLASMFDDAFWDAREKESWCSSMLNPMVIAPPYLCSWVVQILDPDEDLEKDGIAHVEPWHRWLPESAYERFEHIYQLKCYRLAQQQPLDAGHITDSMSSLGDDDSEVFGITGEEAPGEEEEEW